MVGPGHSTESRHHWPGLGIADGPATMPGPGNPARPGIVAGSGIPDGWPCASGRVPGSWPGLGITAEPGHRGQLVGSEPLPQLDRLPRRLLGLEALLAPAQCLQFPLAWLQLGFEVSGRGKEHRYDAVRDRARGRGPRHAGRGSGRYGAAVRHLVGRSTGSGSGACDSPVQRMLCFEGSACDSLAGSSSGRLRFPWLSDCRGPVKRAAPPVRELPGPGQPHGSAAAAAARRRSITCGSATAAAARAWRVLTTSPP